MYRTNPTAGHVDVRLPIGRMIETADRTVRITLPHDPRTRARLHAILERLHGIAAEWFWVPTTIDETGSELVLDYALADADTMPFAMALPRWQRAPAEHLPELVELASYLATCAEALDKLELPCAISPAFLRYGPTRIGPWRLMVVPVADATLADWARASPETWLFTPPAMLLGAAESRDVGSYAIAAALHTALAGELFPIATPEVERFRRALRGRVGVPSRLDAAVRAALPGSFAGEATALRDLVLAMLDDPPADWRERLGVLARRLSPQRTALRWEYEGRAELARAIVERCAATSEPRFVPWDMLTRLRAGAHDLEGALDASLAALEAGDDDAIREIALIVRRLATDDAHRALIERAVAGIDRRRTTLTDQARLHFAHIDACYLGRLGSARARLEAPVTAPWDAVVRATILTRIHAAHAEWAHASKLCKATRSTVQAMPASGGKLGGYVLAYLDHLDGVAHVGAAAVYSDPGYLADAFGRLVGSLEACDTDDPLVAANIQWLHRIGDVAHQMNVADAVAIRTGVDAYLSARGISMPRAREVPPLAWYDAGRLLALSGAP